MAMRFRGGGVGHKSTRKATDCFLSDRDRRDLQASMENEAEDDKEDPSNVEVLPDDEDQEPEARMKEMAGRMRIGLCKAWPEAMSQARPGHNDGFTTALAWLFFKKAKAKPSGRGFSGQYNQKNYINIKL